MRKTTDGQGDLFWAEPGGGAVVWEFAVLVTSLDLEVRSLAQLYRDRADSENLFDELKNQWGWAGFTTRDLDRSQHMARLIALVYNWWTLFVRLADPDHHREAITSRPLLLHGVARQTRHAGQTRLTVTSSHGRRDRVVQALRAIAAFFADLVANCGAVDRRQTVVPHPQSCLAEVLVRPPAPLPALAQPPGPHTARLKRAHASPGKTPATAGFRLTAPQFVEAGRRRPRSRVGLARRRPPWHARPAAAPRSGPDAAP
ncbi:MAG TPA: transposase, partial [Actinomycetota bacterium]|nr:transposase [Actinomycetota bacterium]